MAKDSVKGPPVSFQFYPGDWRRDPAVTSMERHDRSVWIDLVCIMHDSPERGVLLLPNGRPMTDIEISRNLGLTIGQARKSIQSILESGTGSRREDGALYNRRMVRDEAIRKVRTECGSLGGNPNLVKQNSTNMDNQGSNQKTTPSSSSSSSSSKGEKKGKEQGDKPPTEKRGGRTDPAADVFATSYRIQAGIAYEWKPGDFPGLAKLRKRLGIGSLETPTDWHVTVENYFATPQAQYALQDLVSPRYDTFKNTPLDRFGKPINHVNSGANGNGRAKGKDEINRENAQRLLSRLDSQDRERNERGTDGTNSGGVPGTTPEPAA